MKPSIVLTALFLVAPLAACGSEPLAPPEEGPDVQGVIVELEADYRMLVAATAASEVYPDTFYVNPESGTRILIREVDGAYRRGRVADLAPGDSVRAWPTGVELKSLPPQYPARVVELRRRAGE